ncbi:MAG: hypothetical protein PHO20_02550 [Candidatus Peribacteraceae bacterium]|nr:hypothetical protein [Candidatus Peribacteraceae bacterium]MDD5739624.1 hypothetical protein [Candidatus Peribacteraceae bacterium]
MEQYFPSPARSFYLDVRGGRDDVQRRLNASVQRMRLVATGQEKIPPKRDAARLFTPASDRLKHAKLAELTEGGGVYRIASFASDYESRDSVPVVRNILPRLGGTIYEDPQGYGVFTLPEEPPMEFDPSGRIRKANNVLLHGADLLHYVACHIRQDLAAVLVKSDAMRYMADISVFEKTPKDAQGRNTFIGKDLLDFHAKAPNFGPVLREFFPLLMQLFRKDLLDVLTVDLNGQQRYSHGEGGDVCRFERDRFIPLRRADASFMGILGVADAFFQHEGEHSPYEGGNFVRGIEMQSDLGRKEGKTKEILRINKTPYADMLRRNAIPHSERMQILQRLLSQKERYFDAVVESASRVNRLVFGDKLKLYGISYISDECVNDCLYCGHRASSVHQRSALTPEQMAEDFSAVVRHRPEEFCILAGDHPRAVQRCCDALRVLRSVNEKYRSPLQCVTLNIAPQTPEDFEKIVAAADPVVRLQYRIFQETYDPALYEQYHVAGPKSAFHDRMTAQERALQAGFSDVGIGALMGLNTAGHDFEIISLVQHADRIKQMFGRYPKSLSIPRHQRVEGSDFTTPNPLDDRSYIYYHALLRIFLPETELMITSRETPELIQALESLVNVRDLAPRPGVGGNICPSVHFQNELGDCRSAEEILEDLSHRGKR